METRTDAQHHTTSPVSATPPLRPPSSLRLPQKVHASTPTMDVQQPLFLSIDAGVSKLRACVLGTQLEVVWVEQVVVDSELPEYGTRDGVYTLGDVVTCPSEARIQALDLLLEKLSRDCPDPTLLSRIRCISGAGQPSTLHFLTHAFPSLLSRLSHSPEARLSSVLSSAAAFSHPTPSTAEDTSTTSQVRSLEAHIGRRALSLPSIDEAGIVPVNPHHVLAAGRTELARRTGSKPNTRAGAAQLIKLREESEREAAEGRTQKGVLDSARTGRIVLESGLLAGCFLGRLPSTDAADACCTGLFNPVTLDWEDELLEFVASGKGEVGDGARMLREMLGEVETDGGVELGKISPYFVHRFGFSPDCIIAPFSGASASTFLSFPLYSSPSPLSQTHEDWRDALLSLSTSGGDTDELIVPVEQYIPDEERSVWCNPARGWWEMEGSDGVEGKETTRFVASVSSRGAGTGRALIRDLYANGEWKIFSHLSAIVPHGGTIGLDDKHFSFFFPHGEASVAQGFLRFVAGARVQEFPDRKANPKLLLESQFMSLRLRLSHLYRALTPALTTLDSPPILPFDALGFPPLSPHVLPSRLILVGSPSQNPAMSSLLSTIFDSPAFLPTEGGLRSFAKTTAGDDGEQEEQGEGGAAKLKTTAAALGAAYKAAWAFRRSQGGEGAQIPFQRFLREGIEALAAAQEGLGVPSTSGGGDDGSVALSGIGFSSSSSASTGGTRSTTQTYLSLPRVSPSQSSSAAYRPSPLGASAGTEKELSPEAAATEELEPDPPGCSLVALPDRDQFKYYSSMLKEFARLEKHAQKGLI